MSSGLVCAVGFIGEDPLNRIELLREEVSRMRYTSWAQCLQLLYRVEFSYASSGLPQIALWQVLYQCRVSPNHYIRKFPILLQSCQDTFYAVHRTWCLCCCLHQVHMILVYLSHLGFRLVGARTWNLEPETGNCFGIKIGFRFTETNCFWFSDFFQLLCFS